MSDKKLSKEEAIEQGEKTYYGPPCKRGHDGKRFVKGGKCVECTVQRTRNFREKAKTGKPGKTTKSKAVAIIPRNELYDGGAMPKWMRLDGEKVRRELDAVEASYIVIADKLAKARGASTPRGFKKFLEEFGIGRSRAYELLAIADGKATVATIRASTNERQKKMIHKAKSQSVITDSPEVALVPYPQPPVIEAEAIEETPPPAVTPEEIPVGGERVYPLSERAKKEIVESLSGIGAVHIDGDEAEVARKIVMVIGRERAALLIVELRKLTGGGAEEAA
jgi:hypothetical protein